MDNIVNSRWQKENQSELVFKIVLFIIMPFLSFLFSLTNLKKKSSYVIIYFFFLLFGFCFTVGLDRDRQEIDGVAYRQDFEIIKDYTFDDFASIGQEYITFQGSVSNKDLYSTTIAYLVSRVTDNYHFLFLVYAAIFGLFTLLCLRYLTNDSLYRNTLLCFLLMILFTLNQIFNINGVRFFTTIWIVTYAIFKIIQDKDKRFIALILITPLFHIAFFAFVLIFLLCFFTKRYTRLWFIIFIFGFLFSSVSSVFFESISHHLPSVLQDMVDSYASDNALRISQSARENTSWYGRILQFLVNFYPSILAFLLYKHKKELTNKEDKNLLDFTIAYMAIIGVFMFIPSFGVRFAYLSFPLLAFLWFKCFKGKKYNGWIYLMPLFLFRTFYVLLNNYAIATPPELLYMNAISLVSGSLTP